MRAIVLAAGRGSRLQQMQTQQVPKCLLRFDGATLLERHLCLLKHAGVDQVVLALGFRHQLVVGELDRIGWQPRPEVVLNERYELGSVLTVHAVAEAITRGDDILLMDADVLYDERTLAPLLAGARPVNRVLIDREFEAGDEPVKVCVRDGVPIELRKQIASDLDFDFVGESVGFFRLDPAAARGLADLAAAYVGGDRATAPHEEALRDLLLERGHLFEVADVTGAPWIEIDFPDDVRRATLDVLPRLQPLPRP
jgi:choline kinase